MNSESMMYVRHDKEKANKLKAKLCIDLFAKGKNITPENKKILRILCRDHEIKKEVHQYLRGRSKCTSKKN